MTTHTHRDPRRVVTAIDNRTYDTLEEAHEAAFAAVGKAYGVSWHEFGGEFYGKIIIQPHMLFIPDDPEFPPYCWGYRFKLGEVLVLVNTDDGSTGNTDVVYVPYKMVAHWPSCLEPRGYKNNMEDEPQPYAREVVFSGA
ncbi:hypothetical protein [uncultured Desulfovibrio sp.]|uniref:hypothetical protein n=1 Tax=uncultured Desulfovibrio sp. TaxID=167968 RepID=UPI00261F6145|nr:hypothetical protein [uncultured Desulfovibrio sp.]